MNSRQYLDAIKARHDCSDYGAAPLLGVSRQQISQIRTGRSGFGELPALRIAELLDKSPHEVLAHLMAEKSANQEVKTVWLEIARKFAACCALVFVVGIAEKSEAADHHPTASSADTVYIMLNEIPRLISKGIRRLVQAIRVILEFDLEATT